MAGNILDSCWYYLPEAAVALKEKDFFDLVYQLVRCIPKGRVTSYGAIAKALGTGSSARIVGWALNASHGKIPSVPAHRVVNRLGMLSGKNHFSDSGQMQRLLKKEGINVKKDCVENFKELFWDPAKEII